MMRHVASNVTPTKTTTTTSRPRSKLSALPRRLGRGRADNSVMAGIVAALRMAGGRAVALGGRVDAVNPTVSGFVAEDAGAERCVDPDAQPDQTVDHPVA